MTDGYLTSRQVMDRYKISEMTLYRWQKDEGLGFPKPLNIRRRNFFREDEIVAWERRKAAGVA
ncbi:helix-turn-helix domain-containing protein [Brucella intermedia]|jgi:predicted DNA-binding transcriptional regulator AlpA|uniref:helix-turn-helix transcriptional regulator n=1 Tax=Brucella TaxID=234 RepID=UPI0007C6F462|nr:MULTISPECIES: helix-turn-helix domain-containing protein [Brucella]MBM7329470.1 helix-turn-helix domain-containing protein [Agrobacterium sp. S2]KAB2712927.1 helix-turn-helix domain-containing protein [Brucella intermedia]KAB2728649.1 helix-turn-helix domain-containing protein [Brucella anthropi]KAB2745822.1 helix-turn-helix domain-containing protein [Brucella anthropi]KAB2806247.1 helix-turn-helix domain-containing protein [Brucella anthropi]